jgi:hypothetical protein
MQRYQGDCEGELKLKLALIARVALRQARQQPNSFGEMGHGLSCRKTRIGLKARLIPVRGCPLFIYGLRIMMR